MRVNPSNLIPEKTENGGDMLDYHNLFKLKDTDGDKIMLAELTCNRLNHILMLDRDATTELFLKRASVSPDSELIEHDFIFVDENDTISVLGVINGLFFNDNKRIAANWEVKDGNNYLSHFSVIKEYGGTD